jgi:hypothetical protein
MGRKKTLKPGDIIVFNQPPRSRFNLEGCWIDIDDNHIYPGELGMILEVKEMEFDGIIETLYDIQLAQGAIVSRHWSETAFKPLTSKTKKDT